MAHSPQLATTLQTSTVLLAYTIQVIAVTGFVIRSSRRAHHVPILGLIGSTIYLIAIVDNIGIFVLPPQTIVAIMIGTYVTFGFGIVGNLFLFLHFLFKARLLNRRPNSWTRLQKTFAMMLLPYLGLIIPALWLQTFTCDEGTTLCISASPTWFFPTHAALYVLNTAMAALCFLHLLSKRIQLWKGRTHAHPEAPFGLPHNTDLNSDPITSTCPPIHPTSNDRRTIIILHATSPVSPASPTSAKPEILSPTDSKALVRRRIEDIGHRVALATLVSFIISIPINVLVGLEAFGLFGPYHGILSVLESAISWALAIYALPLPSEGEALPNKRRVVDIRE